MALQVKCKRDELSVKSLSIRFCYKFYTVQCLQKILPTDPWLNVPTFAAIKLPVTFKTHPVFEYL